MHDSQESLPREIYIRRRVAAVGIGVAAVLVIVLALFLASRDSGTDTQQPTAGGGGAETSEAAAATSTSASPASTTPTDGGASRGRCADQDLSLQVWPAQPNVPQGDSVRLFATIANISDTTCDRNLSDPPLSYEVYRLDTNAKIWSSIDCTTPRGADEAELHPGQPEPRQIDWSGRRSAEGACTEADRVLAEVGAYQVYALVGTVFSPAATFNITEPAR